MSDDPARNKDQKERAPAALQTHRFSWDPLESVRLALRGRGAGRKVAVLAVVALICAALFGATILASPRHDVEASIDAQRQRLSELDGQVKQREGEVASLERRRADAEAAIADSTKRIAALETRRADVQQQVAELTAPVAPMDEVHDDAAARNATDQPAETREAAAAPAAADDLTPPDEKPVDDAALSASSRADDRADKPSSATVERASVDDAAPVAHTGGPVRVFIHIRAADPAARERARAVAAELERRGVTVAEIRGVVRPVSRDAVRFYYDADREAASELQDAVRRALPSSEGAPGTQDFRGYRAPPHPGTLELWLS